MGHCSNIESHVEVYVGLEPTSAASEDDGIRTRMSSLDRGVTSNGPRLQIKLVPSRGNEPRHSSCVTAYNTACNQSAQLH